MKGKGGGPIELRMGAPGSCGSRVAWLLNCEVGIKRILLKKKKKDDPMVSSLRGPPGRPGNLHMEDGQRGWTGVLGPPNPQLPPGSYPAQHSGPPGLHLHSSRRGKVAGQSHPAWGPALCSSGDGALLAWPQGNPPPHPLPRVGPSASLGKAGVWCSWLLAVGNLSVFLLRASSVWNSNGKTCS